MEQQIRAEKWQRLVDCLDEADALQQSLLSDKHTARSNELFELLNALADEITDFANADGVEIV